MATFPLNTERLIYKGNGFEVVSGYEKREDKSNATSVDVLVIGVRWVEDKVHGTYTFPYENKNGENIYFRLPDSLAPIVLGWVFDKSQGIVDYQALADALAVLTQQKQTGGIKWRA